jgi:choline-sulfatase
VGALIDALHDSGQYDNTLIIYTSDHGEMAGNHGLWTKCVMYEESAGIPLILSGPSVPKGEVRSTKASLVDLHPTILQATGLGLSRDDLDLPGCSLLDLIDGETPNRLVLSEYHDGGSITGMFMIRREQFKYVCYPGYPPQLFDLEKDPYESTDLAPEAAYQQEVQACHRALCTLVDPERANELAFSDQSARISELGGRKAIESMENFDQSPVPH